MIPFAPSPIVLSVWCLTFQNANERRKKINNLLGWNVMKIILLLGSLATGSHGQAFERSHSIIRFIHSNVYGRTNPLNGKKEKRKKSRLARNWQKCLIWPNLSVPNTRFPFLRHSFFSRIYYFLMCGLNRPLQINDLLHVTKWIICSVCAWFFSLLLVERVNFMWNFSGHHQRWLCMRPALTTEPSISSRDSRREKNCAEPPVSSRDE